MATANLTDNSVSILLGNGDGAFQTHTDYVTGSGPEGIAAGDFNLDGKMDLVVTNSKADTVLILLGNGNGRFQIHRDFATGVEPVSVAVADLNGDGKPDLAVADAGQNSVFELRQGTATHWHFPAPELVHDGLPAHRDRCGRL